MSEYTESKIDLVLNHLSKQIYDELEAQGALSSNELYLVDEEYLDGLGVPIVNVGDPISSSDAATKNYVDGIASGFVPLTRTINGKTLSSNIILNASDVSALQSYSEVLSLVLTDDGLKVFNKSETSSVVLKPNGIEHDFPDSETHFLQFPPLSGTFAIAASPSTSGHIAILDSNGNAMDGGVFLSNLALESSIAPTFVSSLTYQIDDVVMHEGTRWRCSADVSSAGSWTGSLNWFPENVDDAIQNVISSIPEPDMSSKLDSTAAAPDFLSTSTYFVNDFVTHEGKLYQCISAVTTAGEWDPLNWNETDMTSPDATLDITNAGKLRIVGADGSILWQEGYDLGISSTVTLSSGAVNLYKFAENDMATVSLILPSVPSGKVGDFVLDVVSPEIVTSATSYTSALFSDSSTYSIGAKVSYDSKFWECFLAVETPGAWTGGENWIEDVPNFEIPALGNSVGIVVPLGEDLNEILSFEPGSMCELYFTQTAFALNGKPTWKIVRQDVENGGAS